MTLFFGGWHVPWVERLDPYGPIWFLLKLLFFISLFIWIRASLPRLRYDQLMRFGWKVLLPVATINALVTAFLVVLDQLMPQPIDSLKGFALTFRQIFKQAADAAVPRVQEADVPALPRPAPAVAARERAREVHRLLALRGRVPGGLHPRRRRPRTRPTTASRRASATRASTRST